MRTRVTNEHTISFSRNTKDVITHVERLFANHRELLLGFNVFVPKVPK